MAKTGFTYYKAETDRFQDIKVKRLKKKYGCTGYTVYQYVLNEIYRVEGCYIPYTEDEIFDTADYWGIEEHEVKNIINYCAEIGLFDLNHWKNSGILTARSIQTRYQEMCKTCKRQVIIPDEYNLISGENTENSGKTPENSEELPKIPEKTPETPINEHKEKKRKEKKNNPPLTPPLAGGNPEEEIKLRLKALKETPISPQPPQPPAPKRNTDGLLYRLQRYRITGREAEELMQISRYGEIGHPIWQLFDEIDKSKGKITMPGRFLLSRLKAS